MIKAFRVLFTDVATSTGRALQKSWLAIPMLLLGYAVVVGVEELFIGAMSPSSGMMGGFARAFLSVALVGTYLPLLEAAVLVRREIGWKDLRRNLWRYWRDVLSVVFVFFVMSFIADMLRPGTWALIMPVIAVAFSPAPEAIYLGRSGGVELLTDVLEFMQRNWPEWLLGQLPGFAFLALLTTAFSNASLTAFLSLFDLYGPQMRFILMGGTVLDAAWTTGQVKWIAATLGLAAFTHVFMLWRGFLFRKLISSNRRQRAWQARM